MEWLGSSSVWPGFAVFPKDPLSEPRAWAERFFNVERWTEMPRGGHFAAMEEPPCWRTTSEPSSARCAGIGRTVRLLRPRPAAPLGASPADHPVRPLSSKLPLGALPVHLGRSFGSASLLPQVVRAQLDLLVRRRHVVVASLAQ